MKAFVAAVPLFDSTMTVQAYRLEARIGDKLFGLMEDYRGMSEVMHTPGLDALQLVGIEPFAGDCALFLELNQFQLLMGLPTTLDLPPDKLIVILKDEVPIREEERQRCEALKEKGFRIALEGDTVAVREHPLTDLTDYLILDYNSKAFDEQLKAIRYLRKMKLMIGNVPDKATYARLSNLAGTLFSGSFYNQPITSGAADISPLKVNALQLLNLLNQDDFDLTEIAKTVERDPSLSISLLRFINARANASKRIDSIRSAVAIMGQKEVKHWGTVAVSVSMASDRPGEITKLSLVRARFAENLATAYELGVFAPSLFMAGLFSLIDVILDKPMPQAIAEVAVDERVHTALVESKGELYEVLDLIYAYEKADWDRVSINMIRNNIELESITEAFFDALVWYKELIASIEGEAEEGEESEEGDA